MCVQAHYLRIYKNLQKPNKYRMFGDYAKQLSNLVHVQTLGTWSALPAMGTNAKHGMNGGKFKQYKICGGVLNKFGQTAATI